MKEKKPKAKKISAAAPKKPRAAKPKKAAAPLPVPPSPHVDFPREGENVISAHYSVRVDAQAPGFAVEVSIDGGPWVACRESVGYWWYDWTDFAAGPHAIECRLVDADGVPGLTARRLCVAAL